MLQVCWLSYRTHCHAVAPSFTLKWAALHDFEADLGAMKPGGAAAKFC